MLLRLAVVVAFAAAALAVWAGLAGAQTTRFISRAGSDAGDGGRLAPPLAPTGVPTTFTLTAEGPDKACAGDDISYVIRYALNGPGKSMFFIFSHPRGTSFVAAETIEGGPGTFGPPRPDETDTWSWASSSVSGAMRVTVHVKEDFTGKTGMGASVPGTGTVDSNNVWTVISDCVAFPDAGTGSGAGLSHAAPWTDIAGLGVLAAGLAALALAKRRRRATPVGDRR